MRKRREGAASGPEQVSPATHQAPTTEPVATPPNVSNGHPQKMSEELRDELDSNARAEARKSVEFERPNNTKAVESPLDPEFDQIATTIIIDHPFEVYQRLEVALKVGDRRSDHGSVNQALDEAETNCRLAHRLWTTARIEYERWRLDNEIVFGAMKIEATAVLQREKDQKLRNKQITDADVDAMCAVLYAEQWRAQEVKRKKVELMVRSMENLNECWLSRCRSLQAMLSKQR